MRLTQANLPQLASRLPVPSYPRDRLTPGIVHLGVGGFHRAHQAVYLDALFERGQDLDFGIIGVGLLAPDERMKSALQPQDGLFTVMEKPADGSIRPRVVGSIIEYLFAPEQPARVLEAMCDPRVRIVSLTITEGGYSINPASGAFDPTDPQVLTDLDGADPPNSAFGFLTQALLRRRAAGTAPFTVMSCDNIPQNGALTRTMLCEFARRLDPELADWVETSVSFPNSMVDRITPVTSESDRARLDVEFGVDDNWPVGCEPFKQWVLADEFPSGRPRLEDVGVQLVDDVEPYELMKLRLLNGGHQALCYLGRLASLSFTHEVCAASDFATFVRAYMDQEATPSLPAVPGVDLDAYKDQLMERFGNPEVGDTLARLCADTSNRVPKFVLPVVREQLALGHDVRLAALIVASWARYLEGVDDQGTAFEIVDDRREELVRVAAAQREDPLALLRITEIFGDLGMNPSFRDPYVHALRSLHEVGARETVRRWSENAIGPAVL